MKRALGLLCLFVIMLSGCDLFDPGDNDPSDTSATPSEPSPTHSPETTTDQLHVIADFGFHGRFGPRPDDELSGVTKLSIDIGRGAVALLAVKRPSVPARCIVGAQLRTYVTKVPDIPDELALYPSHVFNAASKRDGDEFGYSGSVLDVRPRSTLDEVRRGWNSWDVTDIVKTWLRGGPFPSRALRVPKSGPIVFAFRDVDGAEPFSTATFLSADSNRPPVLIVTHHEGCG